MKNITKEEFENNLDRMTHNASYFDKPTEQYLQVFFDSDEVHIKCSVVPSECEDNIANYFDDGYLDESDWDEDSYYVLVGFHEIEGLVKWTVEGVIDKNFGKGE